MTFLINKPNIIPTITKIKTNNIEFELLYPILLALIMMGLIATKYASKYIIIFRTQYKMKEDIFLYIIITSDINHCNSILSII
ncbi:hypothetical protein EXW55_29705 (plasmid) [Bacillus mycoides]|nr:hypothetical protein EXW55_29705 [Bacillus mycoides]